MLAAFVQLQVVLPAVLPGHAGAQHPRVLQNHDHLEFQGYRKWQTAVPGPAGAGNQQTLRQVERDPKYDVYHSRPVQTADLSQCNTSKLCIVQFDNRPRGEWEDSLAILATYNENRCQEMSCCQYFFKSSIATAVSPYWAKVIATKQVLEHNRKSCDYVFWIDDDAALHPKTTVEDLAQLLGDKSFVLAPDPPCLEITLKVAPELCHPMKFNAGVWGVRQSNWGREIMSTWAMQYPTNESWIQNATSWACVLANNQSCVWAGNQYEQGAFVSKIMSNGTLANEIRSVGAELIMERNCSKSPLIYHMFDGRHKDVALAGKSNCPHYFYYSPSPPPPATSPLPELGSGFDDKFAGTLEELNELDSGARGAQAHTPVPT